MAGRILMDRNQSNHNPPTSGSSSDGLCFSVNERIWQRICAILQEAYPNWMPWTELHHTYEQLYQEAIPPGIQIDVCLDVCPDVCPDRSTSSTVSVTQEVEPK